MDKHIEIQEKTMRTKIERIQNFREKVLENIEFNNFQNRNFFYEKYNFKNNQFYNIL